MSVTVTPTRSVDGIVAGSGDSEKYRHTGGQRRHMEVVVVVGLSWGGRVHTRHQTRRARLIRGTGVAQETAEMIYSTKTRMHTLFLPCRRNHRRTRARSTRATRSEANVKLLREPERQNQGSACVSDMGFPHSHALFSSGPHAPTS